MAVLTTIALAALLLEDDYLVALHEVLQDLANYFCAIDGGSTHLDSTVGFSEEHTVKLNLLSFFDSFAEIVDIQELLGLGLELLSLNFYDCVHLFLIINTVTSLGEIGLHHCKPLLFEPFGSIRLQNYTFSLYLPSYSTLFFNFFVRHGLHRLCAVSIFETSRL